MGSDSVRLHHYSFLGIVSVTCPWDVNKCPLANRNVYSSIGRAEMSIGHSNIRSFIGRTEMSIGHSNVHSSIGQTEMSIRHKYMSIRPLDEQKCPLDIQMSTRPLDEWTNGHCLMATTLVSYRHRVRLNQITSLQLPWHCKRYISIGHKKCSLGKQKFPLVHCVESKKEGCQL